MRQQDLLNEACKSLGLQDDVKIVEVIKLRWVLDYKQDVNKPDFGQNMIKLERLLQAATKHPIDLRLESESDKNKREQRNVLNEPRQSSG